MPRAYNKPSLLLFFGPQRNRRDSTHPQVQNSDNRPHTRRDTITIIIDVAIAQSRPCPFRRYHKPY